MPESAFANYPSLAGRTVFVSGGASGIGEAIVRAFAAQRAKVGFVDIMAERGAALAEELGGSTAGVHFRVADITDVSALQAAIGTLAEAMGTITILVNNAANDTRHDWRGETSESWDARPPVTCFIRNHG